MAPALSVITAKPSHAFVWHDDDFSIQITCPADDMFWLRVEKGSGPAIVSDFKLSQQTYDQASAALALALDVRGGNPDALTFTDLAPTTGEFYTLRDRAEAEIVHLTSIMVRYAKARNLTVASAEKLHDRDGTGRQPADRWSVAFTLAPTPAES